MTLAFGAAPIAVAMANHPELEKYDLSSLRYMMWAATPIAEDVANRVTERTGIRWLGAYGATEVPGLHCNPVDYPDRWRLDTPGLPVSDLEVRVVDLETHEDVPPGTEGEIIVRGPHMMAGYLPVEADADAFLDGWVRTGDVGWVEPEGWIHITDRAKEMIKVSGFSVAPAEIEATLHGHPAVADCGVYGVPHATKGEAPKAAIVLTAPGAATADDLRAYVAEKLAGYKHVEDVVFVDAIPRTASGKVLRRSAEGRRREPRGHAVSIRAIGTYLPPWGSAAARVAGRDEDALTMAVQAGRAALGDAGVDVHHVVFITRDLPLLDGRQRCRTDRGAGAPGDDHGGRAGRGWTGGARRAARGRRRHAGDRRRHGTGQRRGRGGGRRRRRARARVGGAGAAQPAGTGARQRRRGARLRRPEAGARARDAGGAHRGGDRAEGRRCGRVARQGRRRALRGRRATRARPLARARRCWRWPPWPRRARAACCSRSSRRR